MAWFGNVSLGNIPDLAGVVNKLNESVKNIEKNFDGALGLEKADGASSASTATTSEGKEWLEEGEERMWTIAIRMEKKCYGNRPIVELETAAQEEMKIIELRLARLFKYEARAEPVTSQLSVSPREKTEGSLILALTNVSRKSIKSLS